MSQKHHTIFVEDSWPPLRIWGYFLLIAVILAIPASFLGSTYWVVAGAGVGIWVLAAAYGVVVAARRHWWITADELRVSRLPWSYRVFYRLTGERRVPLDGIDEVKAMEGKLRAIRRGAFGPGVPSPRQVLGATREKFWCRGAVIVRLNQPDDFGDTVLLSTDRPQEASSVLIQAIRDEAQRRTAT